MINWDHIRVIYELNCKLGSYNLEKEIKIQSLYSIIRI